MVDRMEVLSRWVLRKDAQGASHSDHPMDPDLISKKELLKVTELSYGQLYRWKRMELIPDHWFIRRATFTGQETFFPRAQILERIETIQRLRDRYSLDEIAQLLSPDSVARRFSRQDVKRLKACHPEGLALVETAHRMTGRAVSGTESTEGTDVQVQPPNAIKESYTFVDLVAAAMATELLARDVLEEDVIGAAATLVAGVAQFSVLDDVHIVCADFKKLGAFATLYAGRDPVVFGHGISVLADIALGPIAEQIRQELHAQIT